MTTERETVLEECYFSAAISGPVNNKELFLKNVISIGELPFLDPTMDVMPHRLSGQSAFSTSFGIRNRTGGYGQISSTTYRHQIIAMGMEQFQLLIQFTYPLLYPVCLTQIPK